jgi:hypothetical protein
MNVFAFMVSVSFEFFVPFVISVSSVADLRVLRALRG